VERAILLASLFASSSSLSKLHLLIDSDSAFSSLVFTSGLTHPICSGINCHGTAASIRNPVSSHLSSDRRSGRSVNISLFPWRPPHMRGRDMSRSCGCPHIRRDFSCVLDLIPLSPVMNAEQIFHYPLKMAEGAAFPRDAAVREIFFHLRIPRSPEGRRLGIEPY
jgi:hypothetical protein